MPGEHDRTTGDREEMWYGILAVNMGKCETPHMGNVRIRRQMRRQVVPERRASAAPGAQAMFPMGRSNQNVAPVMVGTDGRHSPPLFNKASALAPTVSSLGFHYTTNGVWAATSFCAANGRARSV